MTLPAAHLGHGLEALAFAPAFAVFGFALVRDLQDRRAARHRQTRDPD